PRYPLDVDGIEIDLTSLPETADPSYWETGATAIGRKIAPLHEASVGGQAVEHISVFGFASIPLLVHLGRCLGNKIPASFYQRHRDTQSWCWKESSALPANYTVKKIQDGSDPAAAMLIISLSGTIPVEQLPAALRDNRDIYLLTLKDQAPNTGFLNTVNDLER